MPEQPILVGGRWTATRTPLEVRNPFDDALVARTWVGGGEEFEEAAAAAVEAAPVVAALPAHERAAILRRVSAAVLAGRDDLSRTLAQEAGKPLRDAVTEVERTAMTFSVAADESLRIFGEVIPLDLAPHGAHRVALTRRFPLGPVAAITPFNFPLNLVAHKLAPALAAGNPIVLKPATKTPLSALALGRLLDEAGAPKGAVSIVPLTREASDRVVTDERFRLLTFTGSAAVGWAMKARAGRKRVILELGGNAGAIVDEDANLDLAVRRMVAGGFGYAGQSCISVQRVFVHAAVFDRFASAFVKAVGRLTVGDPLDPASDLGSLITVEDAERVDAWVREAVAAGARVLAGGRRVGRAGYAPTVVVDAPPASKICVDEVFAPLVGLARFDDFPAAIDQVNQSRYGLQAGVFTNSLAHALEAFNRLEVGGVVLNDVPSWRIDHMPYGGVKDSGLGREGPRYTIEEMTEPRLLVINQDA